MGNTESSSSGSSNNSFRYSSRTFVYDFCRYFQKKLSEGSPQRIFFMNPSRNLSSSNSLNLLAKYLEKSLMIFLRSKNVFKDVSSGILLAITRSSIHAGIDQKTTFLLEEFLSRNCSKNVLDFFSRSFQRHQEFSREFLKQSSRDFLKIPS